MKNIFKCFKMHKKNKEETVESLIYKTRLYDQAMCWKSHVSANYASV